MRATLVDGVYAEHGRYTTYGNKGCRCAACQRAWADWHRDYNHRRGLHLPAYVHAARAAVEAEIRDNHGTETRYKRGCRCAACRSAAAEARRDRRWTNVEHRRAYDRQRYAAKRRKTQAREAAPSFPDPPYGNIYAQELADTREAERLKRERRA